MTHVESWQLHETMNYLESKPATNHHLEVDIPDYGKERPVITAVQPRLYILCLSLLRFHRTSPEIQTVGEQGRLEHVHHCIIPYQTQWVTTQRWNLPQRLVWRHPNSLTQPDWAAWRTILFTHSDKHKLTRALYIAAAPEQVDIQRLCSRTHQYSRCLLA